MSNNVRLVLIRAERLEKILKNELGAEGKGLGEYTRDLLEKGKLSAEVGAKLKWISKIRNAAAHEPSSFKLTNPDKFVKTCNEVQAMLGFPTGFAIARINIGSISFLSYIGIIAALGVQFARANTWSIPLFKSYENAFAASFFMLVCGIAHTAYIWQNYYVSIGILLTAIGGFGWQYKWPFPVMPTYSSNIYIGIAILGILFCLYGIIPQLLGIIFRIYGVSILIVEVFLALTKGLAAVHYINLLIAVILLGFSVLMFRRHNTIREVGAFRTKNTKGY
ncbi:MAG TPA: hypothetical protein V6C78_03340 [Crinalium sp.]|jgi:hypothetical protein